MMEVQLVLATLVQRMTFELVPGQQSLWLLRGTRIKNRVARPIFLCDIRCHIYLLTYIRKLLVVGLPPHIISTSKTLRMQTTQFSWGRY